MKRGDVWLVSLDPTVGSEIRKTRPCAIVSPDALNARLNTLIIVPLTSGSRLTRFRVPVEFKARSGLLLPDQLRAVDRTRLIKRVGEIDAAISAELLHVLREMFSD